MIARSLGVLTLVLLGCKSRPSEARPVPSAEQSTTKSTPSAPAVEVISATNVLMLHAQDEDEDRSVSIAKPRYQDIVGGARVVLRAPTARLVIDYPLRKPAVFDVAPEPGGVYSLRGIVRAVAERYAEIYRVEAETTSKPVKKIPGLENRDETDGKYGIWGHDIGDLVLERVSIGIDSAGRAEITIDVGS